MKDIDLALEQPATGERAFVQVKSRADSSVFSDYIERFRADPTNDRMLFVVTVRTGRSSPMRSLALAFGPGRGSRR
jgi:hypothetical protein